MYINLNNATEPLVSVIIPTFNREYCIGRALNSVINQTYKNIEIIVVDNNSSDNTKETVFKYNKYKNIFFYNIDNEGIVGSSRNLGMKFSRGKYLSFLDSDDWWVTSKIEKSVKKLESGFDIVYHDLYYVYSESLKTYFWRRSRGRSLSSPIYNDLLVNGNAINNSSVVVRRDLMLQINGFSEDKKLVSAEDYDVWIRIAKKTNKFIKINQVLGFYWKGGGNLSSLHSTIISMNEILNIYSKDISKLTKKGPVGFDYTLCRSYYDFADYGNAIKFSLNVFFKSPPVFIGLKAFITLSVSIILLILTVFRKNKFQKSETKVKKFMHVITGLDLGGAENNLLQLLKNVDRNYFDFYVISLTDKGVLGKEIENLGIPLLTLNMKRSAFRLFSIFYGIFKLAYYIITIKPHYILTWLHHADMIGILASKLVGHKRISWYLQCSVLSPDIIPLRNRLLVRLLSFFSKFPETIYSNSKAGIKEHMLKGYKPKKRITLIPNGFDTNMYIPDIYSGEKMRRELNISSEDPIIGYVGRYHKMKDFNTLLLSISELLKIYPKLKAVLVGTNVDYFNLELLKQIEKLKIKNILLLGQRRDIPSIMTSFDLLICSSISEGFPSVVGEAMSCGVPCVVTDSGDCREIIGDDNYICNIGDYRSLVKICNKILKLSLSEKQEMNFKVRKRIIELYDISIIAKQFKKIFA